MPPFRLGRLRAVLQAYQIRVQYGFSKRYPIFSNPELLIHACEAIICNILSHRGYIRRNHEEHLSNE